jgi:DNA primase
MWDATKKSWVLPLREPHFNKLIGWQEKGTVDRTFFNRPTGLPKSKTLFGVDVQLEEVAIVVESPLDCLRMYSAGFPGAVAICGSSASEDQIKLLRYSQKIIVAFDNPNIDNAGAKASKEMLEWGRKYGLNLFFFNYGSSDKKDPGDMTDEEIRWGVDNAQSALFGESAYVQGNTQTVSS